MLIFKNGFKIEMIWELFSVCEVEINISNPKDRENKRPRHPSKVRKLGSVILTTEN